MLLYVKFWVLHTHQAGSLVEPDYLRFDFTSLEPMTKNGNANVEKIVNEKFGKEIPVKTTVTDPDTGLKMGALALFGEKYGDTVRVVQIDDFSTEFYGGTHCETLTNECIRLFLNLLLVLVLVELLLLLVRSLQICNRPCDLKF